VCEALHSAHEVGVVHRNIKPSNVLVMEEDGEPRPKILDLGVARVLDQRLTSESLYSARGLLAGAPCYVPPELTEPPGLGSETDARSDVYSLGVLLYELLAGAPPFDARRLRQAGWAEMVRVIREEKPARPSERGGLGSVAATEVALQRGTEPRRLAQELQGDLDAIVLATLMKDPSRRYSSVRDLATDMRRHLRREPVSVRPPGLGARLRQLFRRR
jgi:serine/threonine protein kinase